MVDEILGQERVINLHTIRTLGLQKLTHQV